MRAILISLFLIVGCTTYSPNLVIVEQYHYNYLDSAFRPIIKSFIYEAGSRGYAVDLTNVSMTFGNIRRKRSDKTVGYCVRDPMGGLVIKIHAATWNKLSPYQQEELIFHEMAHCLIGRDHCAKIGKNGPISIMYPQVLSEKYYKEFREELVDELFNISPECVGDNGHINEVNGQVCPQKTRNSKK